ncbi:MAG: hypothetical protein ACM3XZ_11115 [Betaproteobacteria bacterium]
MAGANIDFPVLAEAVQRCCKTVEECGECDKLHCLVGFAMTVAKYGAAKGVARVDGGERLLPRNDYRAFYEDEVVAAIAATLHQCKNCRDNHEQDCGVSLIRLALERALLGENLEYHGSVLTYLLDLEQRHARFGKLVKEAFEQQKSGAFAGNVG